MLKWRGFAYLLILVKILCIQARWFSGKCQSFDVKYDVVIHDEEYYDDNDYFNRRCCRPVYETLYTYAECTYNNLQAGQKIQLHDEDKIPKYITFKNSIITLIPVGVFTKFPTLKQLYLNSSSVKNIHPGAFNGLINLEELHLEDNNITEITRGTLNSLRNLTVLDISSNQVEIIENNALLGLFNLEDLILKKNKLTKLSFDAFDGLTSLQVLDLSYNHLSDLSSEVFVKLSVKKSAVHDFPIFTQEVSQPSSESLRLDLSFNNLSSVNFSQFPAHIKHLNLGNNRISSLTHYHLPNLEQLDLSNNLLSDIKNVHKTLKYFNFSGNNIQELNDSLFLNSQNLSILDLSHNLITHLHEDIFVHLVGVNFLYLQNNVLDNLPIGCFRNLHSLALLNISSNRITEFEYGTFAGLTNLVTLDISNNSLTYLFESSFHTLTDLQTLNIGNNFLTTFDPYDLITYTKKLKTVSLNNNPWNCKSLLKIITTFQVHQVHVVRGFLEKVGNVNGIACLNYAVTTPPETLSNNPKVGILLKPPVPSNELYTIQKFFNNGFFNSSFYKYFTNFASTANSSRSHDYMKQFDDEFKNTTFYKYFVQDSLNLSFFKQLDEAFSRLSNDIQSLDKRFVNSSLYKFSESEDPSKNFSKYFEDGFKNSTFFQFFTREFSKPEFFRYFNENAQAILNLNSLKRSNELNSLRSYFDKDFENSTFYKFFQKLNCSDMPVKQSNNNQEPHAFYSSYAANSEEKENAGFLNKIRELQSAMSTLLIIVIIILICMMFMFIFKRFPKSLNSIIHKATRDTDIKSESTAGLELI